MEKNLSISSSIVAEIPVKTHFNIWVLFFFLKKVWIYGYVSPGFESQSGKPYSHLVSVYVLHIGWGLSSYDTCWPLDIQHGNWVSLFHIPEHACVIIQCGGMQW